MFNILYIHVTALLLLSWDTGFTLKLYEPPSVAPIEQSPVETFNSLDQVAENCPHTDFCTRSSITRIVTDGHQSCCAPCLCTDDCHNHGNCCPDYGQQEQPQKPAENGTVFDISELQECYLAMPMNLKMPATSYQSYIYSGIDMYNAFVRCPPNYMDSGNVKDKCEKQPGNMEELNMVSDSNGYVYKNKYCAQCHGVNNYTDWLIKIICVSAQKAIAFHMPTQQFADTRSPDDCMFWSAPPTNNTSTQAKCYQGISECNFTGWSNGYDPYVEQLCKSYTLNYFQDLRSGKYLMYKNVHCFLCNKSPQKNVSYSCTALEGATLGRDYMMVKFSAILNHAAFIDAVRPKIVNPETCILRCKKQAVFDPYFSKCRRLFCPPNYTPQYGTCVQRYLQPRGYTLSIILRLRPDMTTSTVSFKEHFARWLHMVVTDHLLTLTKITENLCGHCKTVVYNHLGPGPSGPIEPVELVYKQIYYTNSECDIDKLTRLSNDLSSQKDMKMVTKQKNSNETIAYNIKMDQDARYETEIENSEDYVIGNLFSKKDCFHPDEFHKKLQCPTVELLEEEYASLLSDRQRQVQMSSLNVLRRFVISSVSKNSIPMFFKYEVCWKSYLNIVSASTYNLPSGCIVTAGLVAMKFLLKLVS